MEIVGGKDEKGRMVDSHGNPIGIGGGKEKPREQPPFIAPDKNKPKKWWDKKLGKWHFPDDEDYYPEPVTPPTAGEQKKALAP